MTLNSTAALEALSPLDGRYQKHTTQLRGIFSESGLIRARIWVECEWLCCLAEQVDKELPKSKNELIKVCKKIQEEENKSIENAVQVKTHEAQTNHDVKAVEYWLQDQLREQNLAEWIPWIHFACTSEDINNLAYARLCLQARDKIMLPAMRECINYYYDLAVDTAATPMLSRTHGQSASPTTMGKEISNVIARLEFTLNEFEKCPIMGKFNGAVGNFNAHYVAFPDWDWASISEEIVTRCGCTANNYTTQIEPHDALAQSLHALSRFNTVLIDSCRDMWGYISLDYFTQIKIANEVGSSTMPHKVNPIDFENAEGNLGLCNALAQHCANELPISRWQRDLTDSTVLRNLGSIFGYAVIAYSSLQRGLKKCRANTEKMAADLNQHWEVLAEAIQTMLRVEGHADAYEQLKAMTRGERITAEDIQNSIDQLPLSEKRKQQLKDLTPEKYTGIAEQLCRKKLKERN